MKKLFSLFVAGGIALSMTACLNDDEHFIDFENVGAIAQIPSSAFYGLEDNRSYIKTEVARDTFDVSIASPEPLGQDVELTLAVDEAALAAYNAANGTDYQVLPASLYQLVTPTVSVKAGQRLASVAYQLNTTSLGFEDNYALPFVIKTASNGVTVSGNYATKILAIKIRNNYEADYQATGTFTHPVNGPRGINQQKTLSTIDANTVQTDFADLGGNGWLMQLRINEDNTVTLIPKGAANTGTVQVGENKYDPATQTYTLNYKYPGGGGDRVITETLKRLN